MFPPVAAALALPAWRAVGPERGHVMDVTVAGDEVLALTRAGVLGADRTLASWSRRPRFPTNTRAIAATGDGAVWAATVRGLWRVGATAERVAELPGVVVDLASSGGRALLAVRGERAGVWRLGDDGALERVLAGVDPWRLADDGHAAWLATLDRGLWRSTDHGATFDAVIDSGAVSALGYSGDQLRVGWDDGRVTDASGRTICTVTRGPPADIVAVAGALRVLADSELGPVGQLYACEHGDAEPLPGLPSLEDGLEVQPSGLWAIDARHALLGTFRSGPLLLDANGAAFRRSGFRATLPAAVATGATGEIVLALMSTGVFTTSDGGASWTSAARSTGSQPVSDAMDVAVTDGRILVVDFDGITVGRGGKWYRTDGAFVEGAGRRNALVEVAADGAGTLWGRDHLGGLWRQSAGKWAKCAVTGVARLDGGGDALRLALGKGFFRPGCEAAGAPVWPDIYGDARRLRSDGVWAAGEGHVWRDGRSVAAIPPDAVQAVAATAPDAGLVAVGDGRLLRCLDDGCVEATAPLPGPVLAVGAFADGRVWAAEHQGSFLVADGETGLAPASDAAASARDGPTDQLNAGLGGPSKEALLAVPPWRGVGRAGFQLTAEPKAALEGAATLPAQHASPNGGGLAAALDGASPPAWWKDWRWGAGVVEFAAAAAIGFAIFRGPGRRRRRR